MILVEQAKLKLHVECQQQLGNPDMRLDVALRLHNFQAWTKFRRRPVNVRFFADACVEREGDGRYLLVAVDPCA